MLNLNTKADETPRSKSDSDVALIKKPIIKKPISGSGSSSTGVKVQDGPLHPLQHLISNKARMSQVFKYLNPAKSVMMNDRLKIQNDTQLKTYLKSIGTDERVIFSDSIFVRRVDQHFLEEVTTGKATPNEPINVTCIVTNLSILILPRMAEGFLVHTRHAQ